MKSEGKRIMEIIIKRVSIQFKNPQIGQPTRAVEEHYNGRRIEFIINGQENMLRFIPDELPFNSDENDMINAITLKLNDRDNAQQE